MIFPVHPRTRKNIASLDGFNLTEHVRLLEPLGYLDFLSLTRSAKLVLTDSGGIQEETTFLAVPCLTARENTERPITLTHGTNQLVKSTCTAIVEAVEKIIHSSGNQPDMVNRSPQPPELWDGKASERIARILESTG